MSIEVTTVADDEAVLFDRDECTRMNGLDPDREYSVDSVTFRTLPRPPGGRKRRPGRPCCIRLREA